MLNTLMPAAFSLLEHMAFTQMITVGAATGTAVTMVLSTLDVMLLV